MITVKNASRVIVLQFLECCIIIQMMPFNVKVSVSYFLSTFYFSSNDSPSKTMKKIPPVSHYFRHWLMINLKNYNHIQCLNKNLITYFIWHLEKEKRYDTETLSIDSILNKEHFRKSHVENVHQKLVPELFLILVNNPKQALHARKSFKNKIFWKRIIKKP